VVRTVLLVGEFGNWRLSAPEIVLFLFDNLGTDEPIAVPRHGADEQRLARVITERSTQRSNGLTEVAIGYGHVAPHPVEDLSPVHRLVPMLDEENQQIEIAWDQPKLAIPPNQGAAAWRQRKVGEAITRQSATISEGADFSAICGKFRAW